MENLLSAMNVQRSANQLVRLAFSRDTSDNATVVAWQYGSVEGATFERVPRRASIINKSRIAEVVLIALLSLVLVGIFTVGFAFGWRITDTFRKPSKEAALKARRAKEAVEEKKKAEEEAKKAAQSQAAAEAAPKPATVKGQGVRMRVSPDTNSELVGQLSDGQQVTVLGEVTGTDTKQWYRVKATVKIEGEQREVEGYVRNDFIEISQ